MFWKATGHVLSSALELSKVQIGNDPAEMRVETKHQQAPAPYGAQPFFQHQYHHPGYPPQMQQQQQYPPVLTQHTHTHTCVLFLGKVCARARKGATRRSSKGFPLAVVFFPQKHLFSFPHAQAPQGYGQAPRPY